MIAPSFGLTASERVLPRRTLDWTSGAAQSGVDVTRAGVATYINSSGILQNASANTQRVDYSTGTAGLLIEESRANLLTYSENFADASWNINTTMGVASGVADPWGGTTAFTLTANGATSVFGKTVTGTIGQSYSGSIWIRRRTGAGSIGMRVGDNSTAFITSQVSSAWTRVRVTPAAPTSTTVRFFVTLTTSGDAVDIWGAQLEAGAFATSYIPTTTTAVTRNADVATMTGTNFSDWWYATEGGLVIQARPLSISGTKPAIQFDDNTANEIIALRGSAADPQLYVVDGGTPQATLDAGTITANTVYKLGGAWKNSSFATAINGGAAVTQASGTLPTVTQARLGSDGTNYLNGWLQNLRYWPQRITNAEVQAFSK